MDFGAAQRDLARAYVGGAPGVAVSGLVWLIAGVIATRFGTASAFTALFIGGMLIWPLSLVRARLVFRAGPVSASNPLDRLGIESSFVLFVGILVAWAALRVAPALSLPIVAMTIGARYGIFRTLYDEPLYWVLGAILAMLGSISALGLALSPVQVALVVGAAEIGVSVILFARWKRRAL